MSQIYMAKHVSDEKKIVSLKMFRKEYLMKEPEAQKAVDREINFLQGLKHVNIINVFEYGTDGQVKNPAGRETSNVVYIMREYVSGGLLFDLCRTLGGMGEQGGRYFMAQILDILQYMHGKGVVHRDLKLENIIVDEYLKLKVTGFGSSTNKKIRKLKSNVGSQSYKAPEIIEEKTYDGMQADIFSTGVILFIIVQGIFPFQEASKDD